MTARSPLITSRRRSGRTLPRSTPASGGPTGRSVLSGGRSCVGGLRASWNDAADFVIILSQDFRILAWVMLAFFALDIDRGNLGNATADNLLGDLGLTQADYNLGNTLSKVSFAYRSPFASSRVR